MVTSLRTDCFINNVIKERQERKSKEEEDEEEDVYSYRLILRKREETNLIEKALHRKLWRSSLEWSKNKSPSNLPFSPATGLFSERFST